MSARTCHVLLALSIAAICIGMARIGWYVVMSW